MKSLRDRKRTFIAGILGVSSGVLTGSLLLPTPARATDCLVDNKRLDLVRSDVADPVESEFWRDQFSVADGPPSVYVTGIISRYSLRTKSRDVVWYLDGAEK